MTTEQRDEFLKKMAALIYQFEDEQDNHPVGCEVSFDCSADAFFWNGERFVNGIASGPVAVKLEEQIRAAVNDFKPTEDELTPRPKRILEES